ncbi:iron-sulfur cluster assembly accessory protein [Candidatus Thiothrix sp. Deng01]|uniref:Iron-sulfur cluster assembly accessory protein n=1 Tax=Candidatus Thiothrix phosphatis TaxID=3112415 RepID=A0ABU6CTY7_9GAMM|nr:iron-sulfur cluster assembly accessory protein [Candidatus Thiothrix sp. Deng01]MEB4590061.1 iron-sulfur cluster assembly accessory protein [Candidatus Thiothrix sp. Deng01]
MITVTPQAATQIRTSAVQSNALGLPLRIAIQQKADGSFHYMMGFDDQQRDGDQTQNFGDFLVVLDVASQPLAQGMTLDFVELDGTLEFIFINPNDPNHQPPQA